MSHMTALPHIVMSADLNLDVHSLHFDVTFDPANEVQVMAWPALAPAQEVKWLVAVLYEIFRSKFCRLVGDLIKVLQV